MSRRFAESAVEEAALAWLDSLGWDCSARPLEAWTEPEDLLLRPAGGQQSDDRDHRDAQTPDTGFPGHEGVSYTVVVKAGDKIKKGSAKGSSSEESTSDPAIGSTSERPGKA